MYLNRFVNGQGKYIDDIKMDNMLYMAIARSPYAHARIKNIKGGLNSSELKAYYTLDDHAMREPVLAIDEVNYVGQCVAAFFSENRYEAEDLVNTLEVDYEPLDAVASIDEALKHPPVRHGMKDNIMETEEIGKKFSEKDIDFDLKVSDSIFMDRVLANPMETRGIVADYRDGVLNVYISSQSVHRMKAGIMKALNLPEDKVNVYHVDTGGAFGLKALLFPEYIIACYASMKYKKPVKWIETRTEHLQSAHAGRGIRADITLYAKKDGRITGLDGTVYLDSGAYYADADKVDMGNVVHEVTGPYFIENAHLTAKYVLTNKSLNGYYRGAGKPEASIIMERMIDLLADRLNMDIADIRLKNATEKPFKSPLGLDMNYPTKQFLEAALKHFDYYNLSKKEKLGISLFILDEDTAPGESCRIHVKDGRVHVYFGGDVSGQGHELFTQEILSNEFGIDKNLISLEYDDTVTLKDGTGTWGSRSGITHTSVLMKTAEIIKNDVIKKFGKYDSKLLLENEFNEYYYYKIDYNANSVNFNMVSCDINDINSIKVYAYYDLGKVINRKNVLGSIHGGSLQAISETLCETMRYSDDGQLITNNIADAGLLTADRIPEFNIELVENPSEFPSKAKGIGESPMIGIPSALARSIELQTKKRVTKFPIDDLKLFNKCMD
ncbi:xanthine dehydrogenase family protein molybdopterin-binding subunit [Acidiplasma sp.]|uniref:xanthine dehydrogenase family protein molybdopterin-binding subunit n=1 Tax=Acidiplasma sp. TaxID=1872114 RepID=UPI00258FD5CC|nr:xanthine dehydrogenase family protein molybdopterin-binding subunit [Acidiplasma sp.]